MKSYTDLKQSQELATFLPMTSADMYYPLPCTNDDIPVFGEGGFGSTPCWSLAALLEILPNGCLIKNINGQYKVLSNSNCVINDVFESSVDAAYEMLIRLHELNLL